MKEEEILAKIVDILVESFNPQSILLFGSRAQGNNFRSADFDIAIDTEMPDIRMERKVNEKIEKIGGLYKVDLAYLKSVDKGFREIIVKNGKVIYERKT